jgi:hypothetical protein
MLRIFSLGIPHGGRRRTDIPACPALKAEVSRENKEDRQECLSYNTVTNSSLRIEREPGMLLRECGVAKLTLEVLVCEQRGLASTWRANQQPFLY